MERKKRIFFLLLINLTLAFLSLYILDFLQIIDYRQILQQFPLLKEVYKAKKEDPDLLSKMELDKKWQILQQKEITYQQDLAKLEEEKRVIEEEKEAIAKQKDEILAMRENMSNEQVLKNAYDNRIEEIAIQIESLPPVVAVALLERQEDMMIVDIFRKIEERAAEEGKASILPSILKLMNPDLLARVQKQMLQ
ncbi:MAG: hypothetical protein A2Y33_10700 [Spirochaetes bacterium GWF1_51_8]|nr:MAG: hypothetical protein A2Y33_10700 [Spirochaetes bacterium GWF1_51_8]